MRNIKQTQFGWFEKGAMKKIEEIDFKKQASCKLIYIALCSLSAKSSNNAIIECYKRDIAKFASVSEKTVQRYLGELEAMDIVSIGNNGRKVGGLWEKMTITLKGNTPPKDMKSKAMDSSMDSSMDTESDIYKKERKKEISKSHSEKSDTKKVQDHIQVINMLAICKKLVFDNSKQYGSYIRRNTRLAAELVKAYTMEDIAAGFIFCLFERSEVPWGLEGMAKNIDEVRTNMKNKPAKKIRDQIPRLIDKSLNYTP